MDIEKYKQAKALAEKLSSLIEIIGILKNHKVAPELFFGHFEFVFGKWSELNSVPPSKFSMLRS